MAQIIDGKAIAEQIQEELAAEAAALRSRGVEPGLEVVLIGDDPASHTYVNSKLRTAERLGIRTRDHVLSAETPQAEVEDLIRRLNADPAVHGILVQCPVPKPLNERSILNLLEPRKDVDGLHPFNAGQLMQSGTPMPPCTPSGVMELLRRTGIDPKGKEAVIIGRSDLVGKPVTMLLLHANATVTLCHSRTQDLPGVCRRADILVVAIGRPKMVDASYVKEGAVVIDVGINRVGGKVVGDVDFESASEKASFITPVPRGVGPMTITMLMKNTLTAARIALETPERYSDAS